MPFPACRIFFRGRLTRASTPRRDPRVRHSTREPLSTVILLVLSNIFMTFAWYGHLKYRALPLWQVILASWGIAFVEYCFQVPANRYGYARYSAAQLKTMQEVITLAVFCVFSVFYLGEEMKWNYVVGFFLMILAVFLIFKRW